MPTLRRISTYPIKALDPHETEAAVVTEGGTVGSDRAYAILAKAADDPYDPATESASRGEYVNGKRTDAVHRLRSSVDIDAGTVTLRVEGTDAPQTFELDEPSALNAWLSEYFGETVSVRRYTAGGHTDLHTHGISGPSVVSTATLREVASWFPDLDVGDIRRRFRANLELADCPPFWEDRLVADHGEAVAFRIGDVRLEGVEPCARCVVVERDPTTGERHSSFRETFITRRRETRPPWLASDRFDSAFRLMTITNVPSSEWGKRLRVGDPVEVIGRHPYTVA